MKKLWLTGPRQHSPHRWARWLAACLGVLLAPAASAQLYSPQNYVRIAPQSTPSALIRQAAAVAPSPQQLRWQQLELTGFLHFGINTFTGREWGDGTESPALFNPSALDAGQWVRACKAGGIKQVILTAKHHDGFCLWPSKYTKHSVQSSPWKNGHGDVVKEVAEACRAEHLGFGVYLSPWDRNSPYFGDSARYNDYFVNQLTELLTNYGRVDEVWFDGANGEGPTGRKQVYDFNRWYALIRRLQPTAVIAVMGPDVRWVGTESGYGRPTEWSVVPLGAQNQEKVAANSQQVVAFAPHNMMDDDLGSRAKIAHAPALVWYPAEVDVSIRPGWFYHPAEDAQVKTPAQLLDIYNSSVGRNGVLLLNIPPDKRGLLAEPDMASLKGFSKALHDTYATNLLAGARVSGPQAARAPALLDAKYATYWTTAGPADTTAVLTFELPAPLTFDVLQLQENIALGQRIERFVLERQRGAEWLPVAAGTTVGYKRILTFAPVRAQRLRLRITSSRLNPTLSAIGLYRQALATPLR
ncbi:alpha-L-fucosidase [Hymenobacter sp. RP-2-7]|uniref:alpha-L-fucosidase n=1 Tax=Hymenobacter polaris TaxID=2682546 RepID=A0A7Y0FMN5_9BACT|nr:alpha-L-fucosidase [Hymenobacter polaris]NML66058.1 alpha-L-fucosidase [Hymenobacter polaris]